jgi:F-type H+-transporting ATPase subunit gamma
MSSLKKISDRIASVQATRQITSSMKMVAVSRLKKKHEAFLKTVPFADEINRVVRRLVRSVKMRQTENNDIKLPLFFEGNGKDQHYMVVVITSDEGLSGQASLQVVQKAKELIDYLTKKNKDIQIFCYGTQGADILKRFYPQKEVLVFKQKNAEKYDDYKHAEKFAHRVIRAFQQERFDVCLTVYNQFKSVVFQKPIIEQMMPTQIFLRENPWEFLLTQKERDYHKKDVLGEKKVALKKSSFLSAIGGVEMLPSLDKVIFKTDLNSGKRSPYLYDYEPMDLELLNQIFFPYLTAYIYRVLLESQVSDNASRLMAMDNATRNAGDMLERLQKDYRRSRQTRITTDIAEVSGGQFQEAFI